MDINKIKEFITLAKEEGVSELKYEQKDLKLSVSFGGSQAASQPIVHSHVAPASNLNQASTNSQDDYHEVSSPFVGTFYGQPSPGKPSFVKVGDRVTKGQTLCILEAMKIMNEIESDVSGEIVEICVDNESLVEFGEVLFKIKP